MTASVRAQELRASNIPTRQTSDIVGAMGGDLGAELEAARNELRVLRRLVEHAPALMAYWDTDLRCRFANQAYLAWFGHRPEELIGMHMTELLGPLFESNRPYIEAALRGEPQQFDREIPDPAGGPPRYSHAHYTPDIVDGAVAGFFVLVTDVSARRHAELELRSSEARFRAIFEASPLAIAITENRRFAAVNPAFESVLGWRADAMVGRTALEVGLILDGERVVAEASAEAAARGVLGPTPMVVVRPDGARRELLVSAAAVDLDDRPSTVSIAVDVTDGLATERQLRASEARFRAIFEAVHDGVFFIDGRGQVVEANRGACAQLGRRREELIGAPVGSISTRPDFDPRAVIAKVRSAGFAAYETEHRRADGSTFPVELVLSAIGSDVDAGVVGIARDITARKHAEAELRSSEQRYRVLVENLPGMVAILIDRDLRIVLIDGPAMSEGFTKEGMEGKLLHDAVPAEYAAAFEPNIRAALAGRAFWVEIPWMGDQTFRYDYCPLRNDRGEIDLVLILAKDVTERTRATAAIAASELRFRTLSEASPVGVFYADPHGQITYANARWAAITGRGPDDMVGDAWLTALAPQEQARWRELVATGDELVVEAPFTLGDRVPRWIKLRGVRVRDAAGATLGFVGTLDDLTERRQHALELEQKNDELTRFTYTVSHDLRSPLVTIRSFVGFLETDLAKDDRPRVAQDLGYIRTAAERMSDLLDELLELSRIGRMVNAAVPIPLRDLIDEALAIVQGRIVASRARIDIATPPVVLVGDRVRLVEVFQNLIDNAVKFAVPGTVPHVEIGAELDGPEPVMFVRDHGIGIDPRHHHKLFGLFEKLDPTAEGTGIGLALCKRIVEVHGGRIWAESPGVGRGATFRFTLPGTHEETPP
ncbi:MAG: PAS domain S-box protein [Deltaproteobacteria bacterium]|nr:PAS domain S-box protein [Deltaproteobacteria bacterium]